MDKQLTNEKTNYQATASVGTSDRIFFDVLPEKVKDFLEIYLKWRKGMDWISKQANPHKVDIADLKRLENKVDYNWMMLSDAERNSAFEWLIIEGYLPQEYKEVLEYFGGRVTNFKAETNDQDVWYS